MSNAHIFFKTGEFRTIYLAFFPSDRQILTYISVLFCFVLFLHNFMLFVLPDYRSSAICIRKEKICHLAAVLCVVGLDTEIPNLVLFL